jgi:zona occludens toxin
LVEDRPVKLVAGDHVIIATPWPREIRVRESSHTLYNLSGSGSASGLASGASEAGGAGRAGVIVDYAPGQRPDAFPRSPGYQPGTTYTGPVSSL